MSEPSFPSTYSGRSGPPSTTHAYLLIPAQPQLPPYPYPPPTFAKHHSWYFDDADLFLSRRGVLFGLHQDRFLHSSYFREILEVTDHNPMPRGLVPTLPLPFDDISEPTFVKFLRLLYFPKSYFTTGSITDWEQIKRLAMDWRFFRIADYAIRQIQLIDRRTFSPLQRMHMEGITTRMVADVWRSRWRERHRFDLIVESDEEDDRSSVDSVDSV